MVAMANPFRFALGKEAVQKLLDFNIQWHIASPAAITKVLSEVYRVSAPGMIGATPDATGDETRSSRPLNQIFMAVKALGERIADVLIEDGLLLAKSTR